MSAIERLVQSYGAYISVPWREDVAAAQRVIFCIYNGKDERNLRAKIDEFAIVTRNSGHGWLVFDLTDTFANWLASQTYAKSYFLKPELLSPLSERYLNYIKEEFDTFLKENVTPNNTVIALMGVGSLFGILKVKRVTELLAPLVDGKLLVFFPGSYENNNYRLLDGYDGWNYLAVTITADKNCE